MNSELPVSLITSLLSLWISSLLFCFHRNPQESFNTHNALIATWINKDAGRCTVKIHSGGYCSTLEGQIKAPTQTHRTTTFGLAVSFLHLISTSGAVARLHLHVVRFLHHPESVPALSRSRCSAEHIEQLSAVHTVLDTVNISTQLLLPGEHLHTGTEKYLWPSVENETKNIHNLYQYISYTQIYCTSIRSDWTQHKHRSKRLSVWRTNLSDQDSAHCSWSSLKSVSTNSQFDLTPSILMFLTLSFYSPQLPGSDICLLQLCILLHQFSFSVCVSQFLPLPGVVLEGFTKTAICQGHRLHFAICC